MEREISRDITFSFEGRNYSVSLAAYGCDRIVLPDGGILGVNGWAESNPPQPMSLVDTGTTVTSVKGTVGGDNIPVADWFEKV